MGLENVPDGDWVATFADITYGKRPPIVLGHAYFEKGALRFSFPEVLLGQVPPKNRDSARAFARRLEAATPRDPEELRQVSRRLRTSARDVVLVMLDEGPEDALSASRLLC